MNLKERWFSDHHGLAASAIWQLIESKYSEPHRHYHTLQHLEACFNEMDQVTFLTRADQQAISLSIWFHDLVYDTTRSDNEEVSIILFMDAARQLRLSSMLEEEVRKNIANTKYGEVEPIHTNTSHIFLDIDLSILGQSIDNYREYSTKIRREFHWVPEELYNIKRADILRCLLDKELLYHTPEFWARYEYQARKNIEEEISRLQEEIA